MEISQENCWQSTQVQWWYTWFYPIPQSKGIGPFYYIDNLYLGKVNSINFA